MTTKSLRQKYKNIIKAYKKEITEKDTTEKDTYLDQKIPN